MGAHDGTEDPEARRDAERYDAIVIGAGQGGIPLSVRLAEAGWRVALVEREHLGGSCVNYGCTPTKAMVASARAAHVARTGRELGVRTSGVEVDLGRIVDRKNGIVADFRSQLEDAVDREGLELVRAHARFVAPGRIEAGERSLSSDRIVLDVGARAVVPPIDGLEEVEWLDARTVQELRRAPEHLAVVGGGYVGCEFAQMFRRFGSEVTVLQMMERLLPREDPDLTDVLSETFREEGIGVRTGAKVVAVRREAAADGLPLVLEVEGGGGPETVRASHLLVAAGRRPATEGLGLEAIGLETDERGAIPVDARLGTAVEGVWAIGDVNGEAPFTNVSYDDGEILHANWVMGEDRSTEGRHHCAAVFVDPPLARVGLNEREAAERGLTYEVATAEMASVARAVESGETAGRIKVLGDPAADRILGAAMVGLHADEVIHLFALAMDGDLPIDVLGRGVYVHPAVAEALPPLVRKLREPGGGE